MVKVSVICLSKVNVVYPYSPTGRDWKFEDCAIYCFQNYIIQLLSRTSYTAILVSGCRKIVDNSSSGDSVVRHNKKNSYVHLWLNVWEFDSLFDTTDHQQADAETTTSFITRPHRTHLRKRDRNTTTRLQIWSDLSSSPTRQRVVIIVTKRLAEVH